MKLFTLVLTYALLETVEAKLLGNLAYVEQVSNTGQLGFYSLASTKKASINKLFIEVFFVEKLLVNYVQQPFLNSRQCLTKIVILSSPTSCERSKFLSSG